MVVTAFIGVLAIPAATWRLMLTGTTMARRFAAASLSAVESALILIAGLIVLRAGLQLLRKSSRTRRRR
jgi:hypothetical protein